MRPLTCKCRYLQRPCKRLAEAADVDTPSRCAGTGSAVDSHRGGGYFAVAAEESDLDGHAGVTALDDERVIVVVEASLDRGDQFGHYMSGDGSVLVLVAAGTDGDVEPV